MKDSEHQEECPNARDGDGPEEKVGFDGVANACGFDAMEEEDLLDHVNSSSIFYNYFPTLPDFPCMSPSSSSSSAPAPPKSSSSSSTATSSIFWKYSDDQNNQMDVQPPVALLSTASMGAAHPLPSDDSSSMEVTENFGHMDLIDPDDIWDPCSLFDQSENSQEFLRQEEEESNKENLQQLNLLQGNNGEVQDQRAKNELGVLFFEWLKSNKEHISAEDMRNIKLRRATVDSASKRLGSTKEGQKQLLKLVLEWVEQYQLQKKPLREGGGASQFPFQFQEPIQYPNPNLSFSSFPTDANGTYFMSSPWMPPPCVTDPAPLMVAPPAYPPVVAAAGYNYDSLSNGDHLPLHSARTWPSSQYEMASPYNTFPEINGIPTAIPLVEAFSGYGNQYPYQYYQRSGEEFGYSATKEARKKRMARHRRFHSLHRHHHHHQQHNNQNQHQNQNQTADKPARLEGGNGNNTAQPNAADGVCRPNSPAPALASDPDTASSTVLVTSAADAPPQHTAADPPPVQAQDNKPRQVSLEKRQGMKPDYEKNLKFLLQKVLKQSDVGNLGRIVLPKKEAETYLPVLEARDGISIAMEDIGTSKVWNLRYRFWPNNKSRMYLLENTGDLIRENRLEEGDFIIIYTDVKSGKYMIKGVKVREQGAKLEAKKTAKGHRNMRRPASPPAGDNDDSSTPSLEE